MIKIHKASGSFMGLMFCIWVCTGIVLIFEGFPHASREQRFLHLKPFSKQDLAGLKAPLPEWGPEVDLEIAGSQAVYRVPKGRRGEIVYNARTLEPMPLFSGSYAKALSASYTGSSVAHIDIQKDLDQWVPWSYYRPLLPFYKCTINDGAHSEIYVSAKTGAIVQHTTRAGKWLAYFGSIPHRLYFYPLLQNRLLWEGIIIFLSSLGLLSAVSGIVAGWVRFNNAGKKGKITPYRKFHYKWHHIAGFFCGIFVFTFLLSGLLSVTGVPDWMALVDKSKKERIVWETKDTTLSEDQVSPLEIWNALENKQYVRCIKYTRVLGQVQYRIFYDDYQVPVTYICDRGAVVSRKPWSLSMIKDQAGTHFPGKLLKFDWQTGYDAYYFPNAMKYQPLPVCKITFGDESGTWLYIDPSTGEDVCKINRNDRLRRWLYRALHTFNFPFLQKADWLRKTLLLIISAGLLLVAVTGLVLMWKWGKRNFRRKKVIK